MKLWMLWCQLNLTYVYSHWVRWLPWFPSWCCWGRVCTPSGRWRSGRCSHCSPHTSSHPYHTGPQGTQLAQIDISRMISYQYINYKQLAQTLWNSTQNCSKAFRQEKNVNLHKIVARHLGKEKMWISTQNCSKAYRQGKMSKSHCCTTSVASVLVLAGLAECVCRDGADILVHDRARLKHQHNKSMGWNSVTWKTCFNVCTSISSTTLYKMTI